MTNDRTERDIRSNSFLPPFIQKGQGKNVNMEMTYLVAIVTVNSTVVAQYRINTTVTSEELWNPLVLWEYRTF